MLKLYSNTVDKVVAESPEDASSIMREMIGDSDAYESEDWFEMNENVLLTIFDESGHEDTPKSFIVVDEFRRKATVMEWIEHNGRGFLCSTEC